MFVQHFPDLLQFVIGFGLHQLIFLEQRHIDVDWKAPRSTRWNTPEMATNRIGEQRFGDESALVRDVIEGNQGSRGRIAANVLAIEHQDIDLFSCRLGSSIQRHEFFFRV